MQRFDAIVVGCGIMGSAIAHHLARNGLRTVVLEQFSLNHQNGSSHGKSRIIRTAYSEHPIYVPLAKRALELWLELQNQTESKLITLTGGLVVGPPAGPIVGGALRSATEHQLPHEVLDAEAVRDMFGVFEPSRDQVGVLEPNAGILYAERCVEANVFAAKKLGAEFRFSERVTKWESQNGVAIAKTERESYMASSMILACGSLMTERVPDLQIPLVCERQVVFWFQPSTNPERFAAERMPVFVWTSGESEPIFYGIPDYGEGLKAARHHGGEITSPDNVRREITEEDEATVRNFLRKSIPDANGKKISAITCLYTDTPDGNFIIDFHPGHSNVLIVSACSGHGFKFAPVIGEISAQLIVNGRTAHDVSNFRLARFSRHQSLGS